MGIAFDHAVGNHTAADVADFRYADDLADFHRTGNLLFFFRRQHAAHGRFHIVDGIIDDVVVADFHVFIFGQFASGCIRAHVEADDERARSNRQIDVAFGNAAHAAVQDLHAYFVGRQFLQAARECFVGTLYVCLDDDRQVLHLAFAHVAEHVLQLGGLLFGQAHVAEFALAEEGDFACFFLVGQHDGVFAGIGYIRQTEDFHRDGRAGFGNGFAVFVHHGADFAEGCSGQQHVAFFQCAALYQQRGYRAASFVQTSFDDDAFGGCFHRCSQFQYFGFKQDGFEQCVDIDTFFGRYIDKLCSAAPIVGNDFVLGQLLTDAFRIGGLLIDFVHCNHNRYACRFGVGNGLYGLRHHAVVGGNHQNHDVGGFCTACTHGGKRFVTRGIQEGNYAARGLNVICADVLGNAARFALNHFGTADVVKQRGFTVVDVAHHGNDGRTGQGFRFDELLTFVQEGFRVVGSGGFADVAEFFHHNQGGILVYGLVDGDHHAHFHQGFDHFHAFDGHFVCQIGDSDGFRNQDFVNDGFGRCLEGVLVRLEFEFFAFFAAAHALFITAAARIAVASAFAAFAFGISALTFIIVMIAAFVFFTAAAARIGL